MTNPAQTVRQRERRQAEGLDDGLFRRDAISYWRWSMSALALALLGMVDPPRLAADTVIEQRLEALERQVEALSSRIEVIERSASVLAQSPQTAALSTDRIVWTFDEYVDASPFKVSYKSFERDSGRVELLLLVTTPLEHADRWSEVGRSVPIALKHRSADGTEGTANFSLKRFTRLEPGAHVHIETQVKPAVAASAYHLKIGRADD